MKTPFQKLTQTQEGWQAVFAFQVFHRPAEEWMKMRWGFNAGALLDEALDRYKLFIESQAATDAEFHTGTMRTNVLALRGTHSPETGLQMALLGKSSAPTEEQAQQAAQQYAQEIFSIFPHDFLLVPAETEDTYKRISGESLLGRNSNIAQIQRGIIPLPTTAHGPWYLTGIWQASSRSNEQIWRALTAMPQAALFNITIQPSVLYAGEKRALQDIKKNISNLEQNNEAAAAYLPWAENYIKRRLAVWKKFFLAEVHLVVDEGMENLIHSIGSALTRDSIELALPGYQTLSPSATESQQWRECIRSLNFIQNSLNLAELADLDEVFSIFRFPYRPEAGLPGTDFTEHKKETGTT